jgi:hypothetical protein
MTVDNCKIILQFVIEYRLSQKYRISLKMRHLEVSWNAEKYKKTISFIFEEIGLETPQSRAKFRSKRA